MKVVTIACAAHGFRRSCASAAGGHPFNARYLGTSTRAVSWRGAVVCLAAFLVALAGTSCARFAPVPRPRSETPVPEAFALYAHDAPAPDRWWELFGSDELIRVVERALADNLTLQQVNARFMQAEMLARQAGAAHLPDLEISGDISSTRRQTTRDSRVGTLDALTQDLGAFSAILAPAPQNTGDLSELTGIFRGAQSRLQGVDTLTGDSPSSRITTTSHGYRFGLGSSYEVDLWGRVRARHQATLLDMESAREDVYAAMLSLSGATVRQWLLLVARRQEMGLVEEQLALNKTTLELIELRFRNGLATALDVYQQRQIAAQTEALIPVLEEAIETTGYELAVLSGLPPRAALDLDAEALPEVGAIPTPGLPADLLARRPDVRAAGLQLQAADWRIAAARADRLPALRLSATAAFDADEFSVLFENWIARLAGSLTGPVFDAGRRRAEVERTQAVVEERLAVYRLRILDSVKEVESAMLRETKQSEYIELLKRERDIAKATHKQALERYLKGIIDYLPVLSSLTQLQAIERRLVQAEYLRLERRAQLCVALGGAWMEEEFSQWNRQGAPSAGLNDHLRREQPRSCPIEERDYP